MEIKENDVEPTVKDMITAKPKRKESPCTTQTDNFGSANTLPTPGLRNGPYTLRPKIKQPHRSIFQLNFSHSIQQDDMELSLALPDKSGVFRHENTSEEDNRNSVHKTI